MTFFYFVRLLKGVMEIFGGIYDFVEVCSLTTISQPAKRSAEVYITTLRGSQSGTRKIKWSYRCQFELFFRPLPR